MRKLVPYMRQFRMIRHQVINRTSTSLPGQSQSTGLDSTVGITILRGAKFDVLSYLVVRKNLLYPIIEPLGKRFQVPWSIESRAPQPPWLRVGQSISEWNVKTHLGPSPLPSLSPAHRLRPSLKRMLSNGKTFDDD